MFLLFVNKNLDVYGCFTQLHVGEDTSFESIQGYAEDALGISWSEYVILSLSTEGVPTVVSTVHKQSPLRKHIYLNKRKKPCSSNPSPQSDLNQSSSLYTPSPLESLSGWLNGTTVPLWSINEGTPSSETSINNADTPSVAESF